MEIIVDAVSEYALVAAAGWHNGAILVSGVLKPGEKIDSLMSALGESAADTWMEGDISIPKGARTELGIAEVKWGLW